MFLDGFLGVIITSFGEVPLSTDNEDYWYYDLFYDEDKEEGVLQNSNLL